MEVQAAQLTRVDTTQQFPLGALFDVPATSDGTRANQGAQKWIYVYNDSGGALAAGDVCTRKAATATYRVRKSAVTQGSSCVVGVAQHAIANGSYGWIQRKGVAEVTSDGALTVDVAIMPSNATAGTCEPAAISLGGFGWAIDGSGGAATSTCYIDCCG